MRRWLIVALLTIACAGNRPPAHFLHTNSPPWDDWMKAVVDVDLTDVPLGALSTLAPFQGMHMRLVELDAEYRITLQAERVPRRQALWMLANKYGLSMSTDHDSVIIAPRELHRENKPLD